MDQQKLFELSLGLSDTTEGVVLSIDWLNRLVEVNQNGLTVRMPWAGPAPWQGDRVRVTKLGQQPLCHLIEGAPLGTVQTVASSIVTVAGDDGVTYRYPHVGSAPANGARVALDHGRHVVMGTLSTSPVAPPAVELPSAPPAGNFSSWFTPAWSGNWRFGSFASEFVETSENRVAAYGYGTSIADTIPDAATITRAEWHLQINWDRSGSSVPAEVGSHGFDGRPPNLTAGALSGTLLVPRGATVIDLLGAFADALKTGSARGLGFRPDSRWWRQYGAAPGSGRIYMEWSL